MLRSALIDDQFSTLTVVATLTERSRDRWLRIEQLPKSLLCIPLVAQWLWLAARYSSLTLPSSINPSIETGGLAGESKSACLKQIGAAFSPYVAAWRRIDPEDDPVACRQDQGLTYPLIAKPDIGWCGYGVRRLEDDAGLRSYAAAFPRQSGFIIQTMVAAPREAGLFYIRKPGDGKGRLTSITIRHAPQVTGDGRSTIAGLIAADPRTRRHAESYATLSGAAGLLRVPKANECIMLTTVASLRVGARYENASACATDRLEAQIDAIARSIEDFHVSRFDVRFTSMAALQDGDFSIIEVNGAGSEAIHLWDPAIPLRTAFAGLFRKQRLLFQLGDQMRSLGHAPVGMASLARAWLWQQRLIARYPTSN